MTEDDGSLNSALPLTDDELAVALVKADEDVMENLTPDYASRALLDAVRLIRTPIDGECVYCGWPINANQEQHAEDCPALPWVRAAERAGL